VHAAMKLQFEVGMIFFFSAYFHKPN